MNLIIFFLSNPSQKYEDSTLNKKRYNINDLEKEKYQILDF